MNEDPNELTKRLVTLDPENPQQLAMILDDLEKLREKVTEANAAGEIERAITTLRAMIFREIPAAKGMEELNQIWENLLAFNLRTPINNKTKKKSTPVIDELISDTILREFLEDAQEAVKDIEQSVLAWVENGDQDALAEIRRRIHTLKGESGVLNLEGLSRFCNFFEEYLQQENLENDKLFLAVDWIKKQLQLLSENRVDDLSKADEIIALFNSEPSRQQSAESSTEPIENKVAVSSEFLDLAEECNLANVDSAMIADFLSECKEHHDSSLNSIFLLKEDGANNEEINALFRAFHTIKGLAGFIGLKPIVSFTHALENLLNKVRRKEVAVNKILIDLLFDSTDFLCQEIQTIETQWKRQQPYRMNARAQVILKQVDAILNAKRKISIGEKLVESNLIRTDQLSEALKIQRQSNPPKKLGEIVSEEFGVPREKVEELVLTDRNEPSKKNDNSKREVEEKIRVSVDKLDKVVDLIGELVISHSMIKNEVSKLPNISKNLSAYLSQMEKISKELQQISLALRLVPLKIVFQKMKRLIYDLSQKTTKKINAQISGEETELDKNIVEKISDPLVHMVRNAVDHGIEEPEERRKAGKPENANIFLRAFQTSGSICIEVEDDGRGLNRQRILQKAIENGMFKGKDPSSISDEEIFNLIFLPGFSTAEEVSELSGRGVGMDVVKKNIEALRGNVKIESRSGRGTKFSIFLPLTMAIMDGMLVMVGKGRYIIPTMNVVEFFRPTVDNIVNVKGKENMIKIHGQLIGFLKLKELFMIDDAVNIPQKAMIVVVENIGKRMGLMVDSIVGQHQIVIKALSEVLAKFNESSTEFFLGASILPDGGVGLILDIQSLMNNYLQNK